MTAEPRRRVARTPTAVFRPHYRFRDEPVELVSVRERLRVPAHVARVAVHAGWICARALTDGWATLDGSRLVVTQGDERIEETILGEALDEALLRWFGIGPA